MVPEEAHPPEFKATRWRPLHANKRPIEHMAVRAVASSTAAGARAKMMQHSSRATLRNSSINVSSRSPHLAAKKSLQEFLRVSRGTNGRPAALRPIEPAVPSLGLQNHHGCDGHAPTAAEAVLTGGGIVGAAMATKGGSGSSSEGGVVVLPVMPLTTMGSAMADFGSANGSGEFTSDRDGDLDSRSVALES